jgi:hypothetical protein
LQIFSRALQKGRNCDSNKRNTVQLEKEGGREEEEEEEENEEKEEEKEKETEEEEDEAKE